MLVTPRLEKFVMGGAIAGASVLVAGVLYVDLVLIGISLQLVLGSAGLCMLNFLARAGALSTLAFWRVLLLVSLLMGITFIAPAVFTWSAYLKR